ncbi:MAG: glycosyltransferase family 4 protein [Clostridia bacterium]|nr:glycosyltransferase family 4 protein [Clostridia bacterium]
MSKILILVNHAMTLYNFRTELVEALLAEGHEVVISSPYDERLEEFRAKGCILRDISLSRHGVNPFRELKLISDYKRLLKEIRPDMVFSYTIKPNIYGAIACRSQGIPLVANITGLGGALENGGFIRAIAIALYKYAFKSVRKVFFQNTGDLRFFTERGILRDRYGLLPGSGVNLERFTPLYYPQDGTVRFLFVGRITAAKGIGEYLTAARAIRNEYPHTEFHLCGYCETGYEALLQAAITDHTVIYHGEVEDVRPLLRDAHCIVLPSYHEGMANALLEGAASARPVIATNIHGCREIFDDGITGFSCQPRSTDSLEDAMKRFIALPYEDKMQMGSAGYRKVATEFDRRIVVNAYLSEVRALSNRTQA